LRRWQVISAVVDLRAGGTYRWTVNPGHVVRGTFKEIEPGRRVVFGFGWDGSAEVPPDSSTVTVTIEPADGGSLVTLVHEGLSAVQAEAHGVGWDHYVERLEKLCANGSVEPDPRAWVPETFDPLTVADAVLAVIQPMLRNLTPDDQPKSTPCTEFTCHEVGVHLLQSISVVGGMSGTAVVNPEEGSLENRVSVMADQAIASWRARGLEGVVSGPGGADLPAELAAGILPMELLVHGWDLAQGSGQALLVSDEVVAYVRVLADSLIPGFRGRRFADAVEPAPGAGALERLIAFSGRRPLVA
jgi:uncharacterized protein (TIGR03086 family)